MARRLTCVSARVPGAGRGPTAEQRDWDRASGSLEWLHE